MIKIGYCLTIIYNILLGLPEAVRTEVQRVQIRRQSQSSDSDSSEDEVDTIEADITMNTSSEEEEEEAEADQARGGITGIHNTAFTDVHIDAAPHPVDRATQNQAEVDVEVVTVRQSEENKASNHIV